MKTNSGKGHFYKFMLNFFTVFIGSLSVCLVFSNLLPDGALSYEIQIQTKSVD